MGGQNSGRIAQGTEDWMRDMEKRILYVERRPEIRTAADLLGPGIAANSIPIQDWNEERTLFNGFFHSLPGALNAPDATPSTRYWMGYVIANTDGSGYQRVFEYQVASIASTVVEGYVRRFFTPPGLLRTFGPWVRENPLSSVASLPKGRVGSATQTANHGTTAASGAGYVDSLLVVPVTTEAGRKYRLSAGVHLRTPTAGDRIFAAIRDETNTVLMFYVMQQPATVSTVNSGFFWVDIAPAAGNHTYKVSFQLGGGTGPVTFGASATGPAVLSVDDIGVT